MATALNESFPLGTSVAQVLARLADPDFVADRTAANSTLRGDVVSHTIEGDAIPFQNHAHYGALSIPGAGSLQVRMRPK